jgi:hypothetical protein
MNNINKVNRSAICGNDLNSKFRAAAVSPNPSDSIIEKSRRPFKSVSPNVNQSTTTGSSNNHGLNDITSSVDEWYNKFLTLAELSMNHFQSSLQDAEKAKKKQDAMLKRYVVHCLANRTNIDKSIDPIPNSIYQSAADEYMKFTSDELKKKKDISSRRLNTMIDTIREFQQKPEKLFRTAQHADKEMMKRVSELQIFADKHGYVLPPSSMGTNERVKELCEQVLPANYNNNNNNKRNRNRK